MDNDSAVRWIFDGTSWTTEKSVFWKDKNQEHTFYAYYPHFGSKAESKENIKNAFSRQPERDLGKY
ncbi:fimbrillin family protein [Phocaeicola vulgatus]|nr:fimbrillin family protein [Phocaeicola vulgatus]